MRGEKKGSRGDAALPGTALCAWICPGLMVKGGRGRERGRGRKGGGRGRGSGGVNGEIEGLGVRKGERYGGRKGGREGGRPLTGIIHQVCSHGW